MRPFGRGRGSPYTAEAGQTGSAVCSVATRLIMLLRLHPILSVVCADDTSLRGHAISQLVTVARVRAVGILTTADRGIIGVRERVVALPSGGKRWLACGPRTTRNQRGYTQRMALHG